MLCIVNIRNGKGKGNGMARSKLALLLAGVALVALGIGAAAPAALAMPAGQSQDNMHNLEMLSGKDFEVDFISMMIEHHQSALDMANLVPDRANHQEVKDAAQKIITDQTREIGEMKGWLKQWYNMDPKTGMMHEGDGMSSMSSMMNLQSLKGDAFDKEFLTMMRLHHMSALEMANLVPARATHAELKDLGRNIISSQSAEIKQFEGWLKAWYNLDVTGGGASGTTSGTTSGGDVSGGMSSMPPTGSPGGGSGTTTLLLGVAGVAFALLVGGVWFRRRT